MTPVQKRMSELMELIDNSILLTDNPKEMLMLACAMLQRSGEIMDQTIGQSERKRMFAEMAQ
jgi:hypothetical protein